MDLLAEFFEFELKDKSIKNCILDLEIGLMQ